MALCHLSSVKLSAAGINDRGQTTSSNKSEAALEDDEWRAAADAESEVSTPLRRSRFFGSQQHASHKQKSDTTLRATLLPT
jgi:hypothetical protein